MSSPGSVALGVVPARGGNDRVPDMNVRRLGGRPVVSFTIQAALESRRLDWVAVSTESESVAKLLPADERLLLVPRPTRLAASDVPLDDVVLHALRTITQAHSIVPDIVVTLQPNAPFRAGAHVDAAVELLLASSEDAVMSVTPISGYFWTLDQGAPRDLFARAPVREEMPSLYEENGAIYVTRARALERTGSRLGSSVRLYLMDEHSGRALHTFYDLLVAESLVNLPHGVVEALRTRE